MANLKVVLGFVVASLFAAQIAHAQTSNGNEYWVQIAAHPSSDEAVAEIFELEGTFNNVTGFPVSDRWHAVVVGPYDSQVQAIAALRNFRNADRVPSDAYVVRSDAFVGPQIIQTVAAPEVQIETPQTVTEQPVEVATTVEGSDETVDEARASERELSRDAKRELQTMLQWAGVYSSGIDGQFGRGTRRAMAAWQESKGFDVTGVLTTRQRAALFADYNTIFEGLGLTTVLDPIAGIEAIVPKAILGEPIYDTPFVRYPELEGRRAQMILISQEGDQTRLKVLYDILQTLKIIPKEGERSIRKSSFSIEGKNSKIHTTAFASLSNGQIKGAILVWPIDDDTRRQRLWARITQNFSRIDGVLTAAHSAAQNTADPVDLMAGISLHAPLWSTTGFFVDQQGTVLTAKSDLHQCGRIELGVGTDATLTAASDGLGVALLTPTDEIEPYDYAVFQSNKVKVPGKVTVGGFSYGGILGAPTLTFGQVEAYQGLEGETNLARLNIRTQPGDVGGPVFDEGGAVLGVLLPSMQESDKLLPANVHFAALNTALEGFVSENGVTLTGSDQNAVMAPQDLILHADDITTLVHCWE